MRNSNSRQQRQREAVAAAVSSSVLRPVAAAFRSGYNELIQPKRKQKPDINVSERGIGPVVALNGNDVLCGRGKSKTSYVGNQQYLQIITNKTKEYISAKKLDKLHIAADIVKQIRTMNPPGRFLSLFRENGNDQWYDIGDEKAFQKVAAAFRDAKKILEKGTSSPETQQHKQPNGNPCVAPSVTQPLPTVSATTLHQTNLPSSPPPLQPKHTRGSVVPKRKGEARKLMALEELKHSKISDTARKNLMNEDAPTATKCSEECPVAFGGTSKFYPVPETIESKKAMSDLSGLSSVRDGSRKSSIISGVSSLTDGTGKSRLQSLAATQRQQPEQEGDIPSYSTVPFNHNLSCTAATTADRNNIHGDAILEAMSLGSSQKITQDCMSCIPSSSGDSTLVWDNNCNFDSTTAPAATNYKGEKDLMSLAGASTTITRNQQQQQEPMFEDNGTALTDTSSVYTTTAMSTLSLDFASISMTGSISTLELLNK